ncbi:hypothetical protein LMG29542_07481 [Paraburkholderia humisilvae]|uniref:DUF4232 domain-containing protein n=3 Tax=Paraburkholderia humisilvae TaxID=627669 RepID=A0A6J5F8C7_9BURK|nr:hypothetical protein LMG29542_07481 [Paraburkholderia humisilvae]
MTFAGRWKGAPIATGLIGMSLLIPLPAAAGQSPPLCQADQLTLRVDDGQGRFDGMSHSGVVLKVARRRHHRRSTCSLQIRPELEFQDAQFNPLAVSARMPEGMHPGPVLIPVALPAHASATSEVTWVSGDVFDNGICVTPTFVLLRLGGGSIRAPFKGRICGPQETGPSYSATLFTLAP